MSACMFLKPQRFYSESDSDSSEEELTSVANMSSGGYSARNYPWNDPGRAPLPRVVLHERDADDHSILWTERMKGTGKGGGKRKFPIKKSNISLEERKND